MAEDETPKLHIDSDWKAQARAEKEKLSEQAGEKKKPAEGEEKPKIQVDSDWKAQAQQEKQRLAQESQAKGGEGQRQAGGGQMPEANFETLVSTMATQALFAMGAIPDPRTGQRVASPDLARHHIDMLGVIEEKTEGNLTEEESKLLSSTLYELRSHYIRLLEAARQQQRGGGGGGGAGGAGPTPGAGGAGGAGGIGGIPTQ